MTRVLNEILLLSCMAVVVTGIVVAAASLRRCAADGDIVIEADVGTK